jgi:hypothetical protein
VGAVRPVRVAEPNGPTEEALEFAVGVPDAKLPAAAAPSPPPVCREHYTVQLRQFATSTGIGHVSTEHVKAHVLVHCPAIICPLRGLEALSVRAHTPEAAISVDPLFTHVAFGSHTIP